MALLEAVGVSKRYGGILALNKMHFAANAGEVRAILGENGAGKSTFIQILAGAVAADEGELKLSGAAYRARDPRQARRAGISPVFQELSLIPELTVAENIFFGDEQLSALGTISQRDLNEKAAALFAALGLATITPNVPVRTLSIGDRQLIEIVKGLSSDPTILILDEATSALLPKEVDWLLGKARERAASGKLVLYISHRMDEVRRVADRVTVLRNGETVGTETTTDLTDGDIVSMMLGRRLDRLFPERKPTATGQIALKVTDLKVGHILRGVSFDMREGEVLGVAGLQGHGQRELFMALFGAERAEGRIEIWGKPVTIRSPGHALSPEIGMALLPEDRRDQGILLGKPVRENIVLSALKRVVRRGLVDTRAERKLVEEAMALLQIKADSMEQLAGTLSGGNQQKVVLAKLLATEARILLFFDPTRGVDVGTKAEIFSLMRSLAARGFAILFFSTDLAELANVADRTLVMSYGAIAATLQGETMTEGAILSATLSQGSAA
ncbi:sugar ABC transporter ATP-binding protein [Devosia sp. CN2-171]|uniref:sugar ABC transporter ATP-binding protein n=1 Tax=Devosia sp. CN2-171 TaxID=3400909 RepID=UPI003BF8BFCE